MTGHGQQIMEKDRFDPPPPSFKLNESLLAFFQVLVLEPSKVLQPAIVSVSEKDESRTVQLKHVTPLKVHRASACVEENLPYTQKMQNQ